jgi:hypothetical protein
MSAGSETFLKELERCQLVPANIEFAEWQNWYLVSSYDHINSGYISESVSMGIDKDPEVALLKSLTEYCERRLSKESSDPIVRLTARSDGFAAFPCFIGGLGFSKRKARENAFNEACERYLWARWWDTSRTEFLVSNEFDSAQSQDIRALTTEFQLKSVREIRVSESTRSVELSILLAETVSGGFVTGGAASAADDRISRFSRAYGELLRHLVVLRKMGPEPVLQSFYEKRLFGFGSGKWSHLVDERLQQVGRDAISLPELVADDLVNHRATGIVSVHRCLFINQPDFVGGKIERLCI